MFNDKYSSNDASIDILLRIGLESLILSHGSSRAWYYSTNLPASDQNSISHLIEFQDLEFRELLILCGLGQIRGEEFQYIKSVNKQASGNASYSWEQFIIDELGSVSRDHLYYDVHKVKNRYEYKQLNYLGLGKFLRDDKYTPATQFDLY